MRHKERDSEEPSRHFWWCLHTFAFWVLHAVPETVQKDPNEDAAAEQVQWYVCMTTGQPQVLKQAKPRIWVQLRHKTTSTQGLKQRLRQQKCFYIPLLMFGHLKPKNLGFKQGELDTAHQTNTTTAYEHVARQTSDVQMWTHCNVIPDINVSFPTADVVS